MKSPTPRSHFPGSTGVIPLAMRDQYPYQSATTAARRPAGRSSRFIASMPPGVHRTADRHTPERSAPLAAFRHRTEPEVWALAALGQGLRDARARGLGLASSAPLLSDRDRPAGAGRVDRAQALSPARRAGGGGDHAAGDREGSPRDSLSWARGADRLDRDRGGHPLPLGRDAPRVAGSAGAGEGGPQARAAGHGQDGAGRRPLEFGRAHGAGDLPDAVVQDRRGEGAADRAELTRREADRAFGARGAPPRRAGEAGGPRPRRTGKAARCGGTRATRRPRREGGRANRSPRAASRSQIGSSRSQTQTRGRSAKASSASRPSSATSHRSAR